MAAVKHTPAKRQILRKIRNALIQRSPRPFEDLDSSSPVFNFTGEIPEVEFAENFTNQKGQFFYCEEISQFFQAIEQLTERKKWNHIYCWDKDIYDNFIDKGFNKIHIGKILDKADASICKCEALVSRTGSIVLSPALESGRRLVADTPILIVLAFTSQVVHDIEDALDLIGKKYGISIPSQLQFISGPSKTMILDQRKTIGGLGAKETYVFLIDNA